MEKFRIAELLRPFVGPNSLAEMQLQQLSTYLDLLLRWNARTNLTAVRDPEDIVTRHFGESLFAAARLLVPAEAISVADVGSGAGFPGLPLKIYASAISLTLIESQNKKVTFLREAVRALHLERVSVFAGRAEQFPAKADLVTLRAVEQFESVLPVAASVVRPAGMSNRESGAVRSGEEDQSRPGRIGLLIGEQQVRRAKELLPAFEWEQAEPIPLSSARVLLVGRLRES